MPELFGGPAVNDETLSDSIDLRCAALPEHGEDITGSFDAAAVRTHIVVIGTRGDHATPYAFSQGLVDELGSARLVTFEAHGHGLSFTGRSSLLDSAIASYLVDGLLPEDGATFADEAVG